MYAITIIYENGNMGFLGWANSIDECERIGAEARKMYGNVIINVELAI